MKALAFGLGKKSHWTPVRVLLAKMDPKNTPSVSQYLANAVIGRRFWKNSGVLNKRELPAPNPSPHPHHTIHQSGVA